MAGAYVECVRYAGSEVGLLEADVDSFVRMSPTAFVVAGRQL